MKTFLLPLLLLFCAVSPVAAQLKYDFPQVWHETGGFAVGPFDWQTKDWVNVSLVGLATMVALQADPTVRKNVLETNGAYFSVMEPGRMYGEMYAPPVVFGAF